MFLSEQDNKIISLMDYLYSNNNNWVRLSDLAALLKISRKTLNSYIYRLKDMFSESCTFSFTSSMLMVSFDPNFGMLTVKKTFLNKSLPVMGLKKTFFDMSLTKLDLVVDLDISESSIYRSIKSFNEYVKKSYELTYSYADLQFEGEEVEIQRFYTSLFIETNPNHDYWPFEDYLGEESAKILAREIIKLIPNNSNTLNFEYIKTAIAIAVVRLKQGYKIILDRDEKDYLPLLEGILENKKVCAILDKHFPLYMKNRKEILRQILAFFISNNLFDFSINKKDEIRKTIEIRTSYKFFKDKLISLCKKYNLSVGDPFNFYYDIFSNIQFKISNLESIDFFINQTDYYLTYMKFFNYNFYKDVSDFINEYIDTFNPNSKFNKKTYIYIICMLWPNLMVQLTKSAKPIRALFLSRYNPYNAKNIKSMFELSAPHQFRIDIYDDFEFDFNKIKNSSYDVILSDFVINKDLGDKLIFSFEYLPTIDKVQELFKAITWKCMNDNLKNNTNIKKNL